MAIRVLIADDHKIVRLGLSTTLGDFSEIEVVAEAFDGVTAVSMTIETAPDVVLMDIKMPGMDGIEATKKIKDALKDTRVLMFTSNDVQDDLLASLAAGADGYCLKNTQTPQLILAIQTVHSGAAWLDPQIARFVLLAATTAAAQAALLPASPKSPPAGLSPREIEVLQLLVDGLSNTEMAERLFISPDTVRTHMKHIMEKFQVADRTQAAVKAMREGLI